MTTIEKRIHPRADLSKSLTFKESSDTGEGKTVSAEIVNISHGGLCITTQNPSTPGGVLSLKLQVQDTDIEVPSLAEVMWTRIDEKNVKMGVQFLTL